MTFAPAKQCEVPDADGASTPNSVAVSAVALGACMKRGSQILVKFPDGSQRWCTLDSERSTYANPVILPVGP
jgi:hypothetical protein